MQPHFNAFEVRIGEMGCALGDVHKGVHCEIDVATKYQGLLPEIY